MSRRHKSFYNSFLPILSLRDLIPGYHVSFSIVFAVYFLLKNFIFHFFFFKKTRDERVKNRLFLKIVFAFNILDMTILKAPIINLLSETIFGEEMETWIRILNVGNLIFFLIEFFWFMLLSFEFDYFKFNFLSTRSMIPKYLDFFCQMILGFGFVIFKKHGHVSELTINIVAVLYSMMKISNIFYEFHFVKGKTIYYWIVSLEFVFFFEALNSLSTKIWSNSNVEIDADYYIIIFPLIFVNIYRILHNRKVASFRNKHIYNVKSPHIAELFLEDFKMLLDKKKDQQNLFTINMILNLHIKKCCEVQCICRLMIFKFGKLNGRLVEDEVDRLDNKDEWYKLIYFDDVESVKCIIQDHESRFQESKFCCALNVRSRNLVELVSNFYYRVITKLEKNIFKIFVAYMFYCIFQLKNCVGSLVYTYKYMHSYEFKKTVDTYKRIILKNITHDSNKQLHQKFKDSDYLLAKERFYDIYNYKKKQTEVEDLLHKILDKKYDFYKTLQYSRVHYRDLITSGNKIIKYQDEVDKIFDELFEINNNNAYLLKLYIKYQKQIHFKKDLELRESFDRYYFLKKISKIMIGISDQIKKKGMVNLFSDSNMLVYLKINDCSFTIKILSDNFAEYFGYTKEELIGMHINNLMPSQIARHHSKYLKNYLNRRSGTRLKIRHFSSFGLTKTKELKMISLVTKLEFLMLDDIYLCGLMNPDPRNNGSLMLTEFNGNVVSMNEKAQELFGEKVYKSSYSLFLAVPCLLKYYFPKVSQHTVHQKIVGKRKKMLTNEVEGKRRKDKRKLNIEESKVKDNLEIKTLQMNCFMFHLLTVNEINIDIYRNMNITEGIQKWKSARRTIIENQKQDLKETEEPIDFWKTVRHSKYFLKSGINLLPRYIKILAKIIAKNRLKLQRDMQKLLQIGVTFETFSYKLGLEFKLLDIHNVEKVNQRTQMFFKIAANHLEGDLADLFLVSPEDLNNLYSILKLEMQMMAIIDQSPPESVDMKSSRTRRRKPSHRSEDADGNLLSIKGQDEENYKFKHASDIPEKNSEDISEYLQKEFKEEFILLDDPSFARVSEEDKWKNYNYFSIDYNFGRKIKTKKKLEKKKKKKANLIRNIKGNYDFNVYTPNYTEKVEKFLSDDEDKKSEKKKKNPKIKQSKTLAPYEEPQNVKENPKITVNLPDDGSYQEPLSERSDVQIVTPKEVPSNIELKDGYNAVDYQYRVQRSDVRQGSILRLNKIEQTFKEFKIANKERVLNHMQNLNREHQLQKEELLKKLSKSHGDIMKDGKIVQLIQKVKMIIGNQGVKSIVTSMRISPKNSEKESLDLNKNLKILNANIKGKKKNDLSNFGGSSFISKKNSRMFFEFLQFGVHQKFKELSYSTITITKLIFFFVLFISSFYLKILNNQIIFQSGNIVGSVVSFQEIVQPQSFLLKEIEKYELVYNKKLEFKNGENEDLKIFDIDFIQKMYRRIKDDFKFIIRDNQEDLAVENINFYKREEILKEEIADTGFGLTFISSIYDYKTMIDAYDVQSDTFEDLSYFDSDASIKNILQLLEILIKKNDDKMENYNKYISDYKMSYIVFASITVVLSFSICIFITNFSLRVNTKIVKMSQLLLQIEDAMISIFKKRYSKLVSASHRIRKEKDEMLKRGLSKKLTLTQSKKSKSKTFFKSFTRKEEEEEEEESELWNDEYEINMEKIREAYETKNHSRNSRYKTMGNMPKASKGILLFFIFLTTLLINCPILVDYLLQVNSLDTLNKLKDASNYSAILSSAVLSVTALFYSKTNSIYFKDKFTDIEANLTQDLEKRMNLRNKLKESLSVAHDLDVLKGVNICRFLSLTEENYEICQKITDYEENYDMFLAMNELNIFQKLILSTLESAKTPGKDIISTAEFLKKDKLAYFLSMALVKLNTEVTKEVEENKQYQINLTYIYFFSFPLFLVIYFSAFRIFFSKMTIWNNVKKLENTFLSLPSIIMLNNSGLKNYFAVKRGETKGY